MKGCLEMKEIGYIILFRSGWEWDGRNGVWGGVQVILKRRRWEKGEEVFSPILDVNNKIRILRCWILYLKNSSSTVDLNIIK